MTRIIEGKPVVEVTNAQGIRAYGFIPFQKKVGVKRVLVVGDSHAEAYNVELQERFSEILAKKLAEEYPEELFEVINIGVGGYSTDQMLIAYEGLGRRFNPDFVVLTVCGNDPSYNWRPRYWRGLKPLYKIENGTLVLSKLPGEEGRIQWEANSKSREKNIKKDGFKLYLSRFLAYSYASIWRRNNIDDLLYDQPDNGRTNHEIVSQIPHSKLSPSWEMTRMLLLKIKELVESDGAKFGILHVPVKEHFYKRLSGAPSKGEFFNVLSSIVKQESIVMFDPYNDMFSFAKKNRNQKLFQRWDGHWTPLGHAIVGQSLFTQFSATWLGISS